MKNKKLTLTILEKLIKLAELLKEAALKECQELQIVYAIEPSGHDMSIKLHISRGDDSMKLVVRISTIDFLDAANSDLYYYVASTNVDKFIADFVKNTKSKT